MKQQYLLVVKVFLVFLLLCTREGHCSQTSNKSDCFMREKPSPKGNSQELEKKSFCDKLFKGESDEEKKTNGECLLIMNDYFKSAAESEETINDFINTCKEFGKTSKDCVLTIFNLETLCHNMTTAKKLLTTLGKEKYEAIGKYEGIMFLWNSWEHTNYLPLFHSKDKCLAQFIGYDYKEKCQILQSYREWYRNQRKSFCTCFEVIGLGIVHNSKARSGELEKTGKLSNYFNEICLIEYNERDIWQINHFLAISRSEIRINPKTLKTFLSKATKIVTAGWGSDYFANSLTDWSFDSLRQAIDLKPNTLSVESLSLVVIAIDAGFIYKDFKDFMDITAKSDGIGNFNCRSKIFDSLFIPGFRAVLIDDSILYTRNSKFWTKNSKKTFNKHLNFLLEMFKRSNYEDHDCTKFLEVLEKLQQSVYQTKWLPEEISILLKKTFHENKNLDTMLDCFNFCSSLEWRICNLRLLKGTRDSEIKIPEDWLCVDDYTMQMGEFRKKLFSRPDAEMKEICNDIDKYSKSEKDVLSLMKIIFGIKERKLQKLFKSINDNLFKA